MSAGFTFKSMGEITFPIVNENGESIKTYIVKIGTEDFLRLISEKGAALLKSAHSLADGEYLSLISSMREFVDLAFGAGEFDFLYEKFERNPFAMIELVAVIQKLGATETENRMKKYVG